VENNLKIVSKEQRLVDVWESKTLKVTLNTKVQGGQKNKYKICKDLQSSSCQKTEIQFFKQKADKEAPKCQCAFINSREVIVI
jgi:hypothetical protein